MLPLVLVASSVEPVGAVGSVRQAAQCQREGTAGNKEKGNHISMKTTLELN